MSAHLCCDSNVNAGCCSMGTIHATRVGNVHREQHVVITTFKKKLGEFFLNL